jgi:hypothetical protein
MCRRSPLSVALADAEPNGARSAFASQLLNRGAGESMGGDGGGLRIGIKTAALPRDLRAIHIVGDAAMGER